MGTAVVHRLFQCHFRVCISEIANPLAVTREAAFCEAIYEGEKAVEGVTATKVESAEEIPRIWEAGHTPIIVASPGQIRQAVQVDVLVDAIMAKRNTGTGLNDAAFVVGLGPGFKAGRDTHVVVETNNSNNLGRVILEGEAEANTGIPIPVGGYSYRRVFHPPQAGRFTSDKRIGVSVRPGDVIGFVDSHPIQSEIGGILRGLIRSGVMVNMDTKLAEIDPLCRPEDCGRIRALPRAIAGGVVEAILNRFNLG